MTPDEHLEEAQRLLVEAERLEKTPRVHLSKNFALLAIGHSLAALAQHASTGTAPGAFGRTSYVRLATAVETIAHDAQAHLSKASAPCVICKVEDPDGPVDSEGNVWCTGCHDAALRTAANA
jgi:hypothetical protein